MIVRLQVVVQHVVAVERLLGLLAERRDSLVHLIDDAILGARLTSHKGRQRDETLRAVLTHQRSQLLDTLNGGHGLSVLEQILISNMHEDNWRLDRIVHLERVSQVFDGSATNELNITELLDRIELELLILRVLLLLSVIAAQLVSMCLIENRVALQVLVQVLELYGSDEIADDEEIAMETQRKLDAVRLVVIAVQLDMFHSERSELVIVLVDLIVVLGEDPVGR